MMEIPKDFDYKTYPVLIVDDDKSFLTAFVDEISGEFTVFSAESAQRGLDIIDEHSDIAMVLVDQRMPGATGVQLLGKLRTQYPDITRVLITGYADIQAAIDAVNIGAIFKYISKPYKYEEVTQVIQRGIERCYFSRRGKQLQREEIEHLRRNINAESLAALNTLTYGFSHHFKNELSAALTFFGMLPEKLKELIENMPSGFDKEYWYQFSQTAEKDVKSIIRVINDLCTYSIMEDYDLRPRDIIKFLDSEKEVFNSLAQGKKINFQYDVPKKLPLVSLDMVRLAHALENIVLNAIQAIPKKGTIKLSIGQDGARLKISVADNGAGIKEEDLKKIFYPFFTTKDPQTKGLGLTVADTIVRHHSGHIDVESKPKQGTTVVIKLPL